MEKELSNVILGESGEADRFKLKIWGITFKMQIRLLTARQLIQIGGEVSKLREIEDPENTMFQVVMQNSGDLKAICKVITIATGTYFQSIIYRAIMRLPLVDIQTLFDIIIKQSDAERFFFIISAGRRLNILKKKQE